MGVAPVLALSLLLQFTAAILSLHMVRVTGRRSAWLLIALAIALYRVISGDLVHPPDLSAELGESAPVG